LNSQCDQPLVCTFQKCHAACAADKDCPTGQLCVKTTAAGVDGGVAGTVCQLPAEIKCVYNSQCMLPLVCARDEQCRNQCQTSVDCVMGQVCTTSGVCASVAQLAPGTNDVPVVTSGLGGAAGQGAAGAGGGGGAATGMGGAAGAAGGHAGGGGAGGAAGAGTGGTAGGAGGAAGSSGGCGSGCGVGMQCVSGACVSCGHSAETCCDGVCGANLMCSTATNTCTCGGTAQPCCGGTTCTSGLACVNGMCACGGAGQTCCTGSSGKTCNGTLICGGLTCGCTQGCDQSSYWKTDGTIWYQNAAYSNLDGSLFKAVSYSWNSQFACAVKADGTAWCWGNDNYGQLGNAMTVNMNFTYPQQVMMDATATTPLTGITSIGVSDYGNTACAVGAAGAVYCWGLGTQGQLGNGTMGNSNFAVPVTLDVNQTMPFTGAAKVSLSYQHTCALMTDKSLWCWGDNSQGQIGIGSATATTVPNPAQVTTLMKNVTSVITTYGEGYNTCASTNDGKAYCWGYNAYGATGDGTFTAGNAPVRVPGNPVMVDASTTLTGVAQVLNWNAAYKFCALKTDGTIWCWGLNSAGSFAAHLLDSSQTAVAGVTIAGRSCYLDNNDQVVYNQSKSGYQLTCN
jgi:alpha-tubulin suppressor-like RCC1 family protein